MSDNRIDRRTLLQSSGLAAMSVILPQFGSTALAASLGDRARSREPSYAGLPSFNGGRSQVCVSSLQTGGDYPFLNLLKTAQTWSLNDASGVPAPDTLDSDGYPIEITGKGIYTVFFVPSQTSRPGDYVITWDGNGTLSLGMNNKRVSGSLTSTTGSGRYVFATTDTSFVLRITAVGNPRITNLQVFHTDDEPALKAGEIFGKKFKERLLQARFGVIRFLAWQKGNDTNVSTWATRKPLTYYSYNAQELRPSLYAGITTNDGSAYSVNSAGFRLVDKATVIVKFNSSCDGPCTLNVNDTGPIKILSEYSTPLAPGKHSNPIGGTWQSLATLVYDATLNAWIKHGGDIAMGSAGLHNGCPPELMVRLCAEVGAHPYFVTPHLAIDPATDFMPSLAACCRNLGPAWMIPRFEGPNELWNTAPGFYPTGYAHAKATAYGWGADHHNWYGKIMSVLGQIVSEAYSGDRTKYQVLCGVQTVLGDSTGGTASCNARLASTRYLAQSDPPQAPYTKTPASKWVTHVCCAQYFGPAAYKTPEETNYATAYAEATGRPDKQMSIASDYAATVNRPWKGQQSVLDYCAREYSNWKAWAKGFGVRNMCGYEGGYSPDYTGRGKSEIDLLRAASKQAPILSTLTITNYRNFIGLTDLAFEAEFPSCFILSGPAPSLTCWAVLEDVYQVPDPPQWTAIVEFNR
jgi:hypothetical protein